MSGAVERRVDEVIRSEVVVVGAGVAGLRAALSASPRSVQILSAGTFGEAGSSPLAQGGVAAALGPGDTPEQHAADTLAAAAGSADEEAVRLLVQEGPGEICWLWRNGARFDLQSEGALALGREAAHSRARIVHAGGDATGAELVRALGQCVSGSSHVQVMERARALTLVRSEGRVTGVLARHRGGALVLHQAAAVVLATGGLGALYERTTNPAGSLGDGLAMAALADARLVDLEYVQFHPTALDVGGVALPLLTEALRGAGARLVDSDDLPIMEGIHPDGDLAPRDIVARAVWNKRRQGGKVLLDAREVWRQRGAERFPTLQETCRKHGFDPGRDRLPVTPAAHFSMGGVWTDLEGRTSVPGLWACGEVACTSVHGANRLASNSLLEALVFGRRVGESVRQWRSRPLPRTETAPIVRRERESPQETNGAAEVEADLRRWMWQDVGLIRHQRGLARALGRIEGRIATLGTEDWRQMPFLVAQMLTTAALARQESRGSHYRSDFPGGSVAGEGPVVIEVETRGESLPRIVTTTPWSPRPSLAGQGRGR